MNTLILVIWAALGTFYLIAGLANVVARPLKARLAAPSLAGNLLMATCFLSFLASRILVSGPLATAFGYGGFLALFAALALDVVRRGREKGDRRTKPSDDAEEL